MADAFLENEDYKNAIMHYKEALDGNFQNDFYVIKNMIEAYHNLKDNTNVVTYGERIKAHAEFNKTRTQFLYGLALEKENKLTEAEEHLRAIDIRFSFYEERLIFANFLLKHHKTTQAKEILEALVSEGQHMTKPSRKLYRTTIAEAEKLLASI
ncbi:MAG: hypothetical protein ACON5F_03035 [Jejuia sp.]